MQDLLQKIADLKAQNTAQQAQLQAQNDRIAEQEKQLASQELKILGLEDQLAQHLKRLYGRSSEKQLNLQTLPLFSGQMLGEADLFEDEAEKEEEPATTTRKKRKKRNPHTKKLPKHLRPRSGGTQAGRLHLPIM